MALQCTSATCVPNFLQLPLHLPPAPHPLPLFSLSPPVPLPPTLPLPLNNCSWLALWSWPWWCCCGPVLQGHPRLQWQRPGNPKGSANQTDRRKQGAEEAGRSRSHLDHQMHLKTPVERKFLWKRKPGKKYSFRYDKLLYWIWLCKIKHTCTTDVPTILCSGSPSRRAARGERAEFCVSVQLHCKLQTVWPVIHLLCADAWLVLANECCPVIGCWTELCVLCVYLFIQWRLAIRYRMERGVNTCKMNKRIIRDSSEYEQCQLHAWRTLLQLLIT